MIAKKVLWLSILWMSLVVTHCGRIGQDEIDCIAPHLERKIWYDLWIHAHAWQDVGRIFHNKTTVHMQLIVSTQQHAAKSIGERAWLHTVEVRRVKDDDLNWLSQNITLRFLQEDCSELKALAFQDNSYQLDDDAKSFLQKIVIMVPLHLRQGNASSVDKNNLQGEMELCTNWSNDLRSQTNRIGVSVHDVYQIDHRVKRVSRSWLENATDRCGDPLRHFVTTVMVDGMILSNMSIQRSLVASEPCLTASHVPCHTPTVDTHLLNERLSTLVANLTIGREQSEQDSLVSDRDDAESWSLRNVAECKSLASNEHTANSKTFQNDTTPKFGQGELAHLFLGTYFQQRPVIAHSPRLREHVARYFHVDGMLEEYRRQNKMNLVRMQKCDLTGSPPLDNASVALDLVSTRNCTMKLSFEELPSVHLLTEFQAQVEAVFLTPVTTHVYASAVEVNALNIHTDPYDVIVVQTQGSKLWTICMPRANHSGRSDPRNCTSQADRALQREMHGWHRTGGSNYAKKELDSMDCEHVETRVGDVLYLPRSFVHVAEATSSEPSIHITFGLQEHGRRWRDVLELAVQSVVCLAGTYIRMHFHICVTVGSVCVCVC